MDELEYRNLRTLDVDAVIEQFHDAVNKTPKGRESYAKHMKVFLTWARDEERVHPLAVQPYQLSHFREYLESAGWAKRTVEQRWRAVSSFYRFLVETGRRSRSPFDSPDVAPMPTIGFASPVDALGGEVYRAFMSAALSYPEPRVHLIVSLLGVNGLKIGEVEAANVEDVRQQTSGLVLRIPKRRGVASTPLVGPQPELVREAIAGRSTGPLILNRSGGRTNRRNVHEFLQRIATRADVPKPTPGLLRNTAAVTAATAGATLDDIVMMLGVDDKTAYRYIHHVRVRTGRDHPATLVWERLQGQQERYILLEHVDRLLLDKTITPVAPIVLTGAALEQHLVRLCEGADLEVPDNAGIEKLKGWLIGERLVRKADGKAVDRWRDLRNGAAHGRVLPEREDARTMLREVRSFIARYPA